MVEGQSENVLNEMPLKAILNILEFTIYKACDDSRNIVNF